MAISKVKLPDNSTQDIHDARISGDVVKGNARVFYGTCDTASGTAAKEATCSGFTSADLENGTIVLVKFSTINTASVSNLTLNVNSTGAIPIKKVYHAAFSDLTNASELRAITTIFVYSHGTSDYWILVGSDMNTTYYNMSQSDFNESSNSTGYRVSPNLLKANFYTKSEIDTSLSAIPTFVHLTDESAMPATPDANTIYMIDVATS